jgi:diaminopimelate epimerase
VNEATRLTLIKGHGTQNDFLLVPSVDAFTPPPTVSPELVAALCDRHSGIGADGVIRVVPPRTEGNSHLWFMDYRNSDGSVAQMCGNGSRVFVRYLLDTGLLTPDVDGHVRIATRAGEHEVRVHDDGTLAVSMGAPSFPAQGATPVVSVADATASGSWNATAVLMPNPHAVVFVGDLDDAGALLHAPAVAPSTVFPDGVNVEFVVVHAPGHLSMRVHERGSGETLSCGTGACAAVVAARLREGAASPNTWRVDVPGGTLTVTETDDDVILRGPAVLVGEVTIPDPRALVG